MILTKEQQAILDGQKGETLAKVMKSLVMYGEAFNAERLVPVSEGFGHTVISFGTSVMRPVNDLYDMLLKEGLVSKQKFSADPLPMDIGNVPSNLIQNIVFKVMYSEQERLEKQLEEFGLLDKDAYTCACYFKEVGNVPKKGDILSWAESSAVSYANSVLAARCNRNSGIIELFGSITGYVPEFGLLTDEGRKATWVVEVKCKKKPEAQLLGSAIGMKVLEEVPYVKGMNKWLGEELNEEACTYLKDFGAACASNGSVGLYHIENLTPEAKEQGESIIVDNPKTYIIDDEEIERIKNSYPVVWKNKDAKPKLCFMGCPHMSYNQLIDWTIRVENALKEAGNSRVLIPTVFTSAPAVIKEFKKSEYYERLIKTGVRLSFICPLMYMNNPMSTKIPVITSSNKLRTYTTARFYSEEDILVKITKGDK